MKSGYRVMLITGIYASAFILYNKKHCWFAKSKSPRSGFPKISKIRDLSDDQRFTLTDPSGNTIYIMEQKKAGVIGLQVIQIKQEDTQMSSHIFDESNGLWYEQRSDYLIPCLELPADGGRPLGIWGQRHLRYIKQYKRMLYISLLTSGKLNGYLADLDAQAQERFDVLVGQMAECEGVTEQLKAESQMEWVGRMNPRPRR